MAPRAYQRSAEYYDTIYHKVVDYEGDCDYLEAVFRKFSPQGPQAILDLGCGTGSHAVALAKRGYEVTGLDLSSAQLRVAREKVRGTHLRAKFVYADMRQFDLDRRFDAAIAMFGGFGYLLSDRDVLAHLRTVRRHLGPGGLYAFEFWQESGVVPGHRGWVHVEKPFRIMRLDASRYDPKRHRLSFDFHYFVFRGDRLQERFTEPHTVRVHSLPGMRALLSRGGFRLLAAHEATPAEKGFHPVRRETFRIIAIVRPQ